MIDGGDVRKVLVLSGAVGSGHDAMARGIVRELAATHPEVEVQVADGLDVIRDGMATEWRDHYESMANRAGGLELAVRYRAAALPIARDLARSGFDTFAEGPLATYINEQAPDVVVTTFPYVAHAVAKAKADGRLGEQVQTLTTLIDPDPHRGWFGAGNAAHATMFPGDFARIRKLDPLHGSELLGLRQGRPPIDLAMFRGHDRDAVRTRFGLPTDRPVVLVSGGSLGLGMDAKFVQRLIDANPDVTYAIAAGRNEHLLAEVNGTFSPRQAVAIGYTKEMPALLATSDAAITNSGGMTTIEAFAAGTPVILHNVVPGHGTDAAKALDADGIATYARSGRKLRAALSSVGRPEGELAVRARQATTQLFSPSIPSMSDVVLGARSSPGGGTATSAR